MAIDPAAGRIYWANLNNHTISFAKLDGSGGGGQLSTAGATVSFPVFLALLRAPAGAGAPAISGGGEVGQELTCSQGSWAADLLGSFLYRAPRSFAHQWRRDGADIPGATQPTYTPSSPGEYSCRVTATNQAGSTSQTSAPRTVSATPTPPDPDPTPDPTPPAPELEIIGLDRDRADGTATLTVATNVGGNLGLEKTNKVKGAGPATLDEAGTAELEVVPRNKAAKTLARKGKLTVNPKILLITPGDATILLRHEFELRQD